MSIKWHENVFDGKVFSQTEIETETETELGTWSLVWLTDPAGEYSLLKK